MKLVNLMPSLLIIHQVKLRGGIQYRVLDRKEEREEKKETAELKTERIIFDKEEFDKGRALRAQIENLMRSNTGAAASDIGLFAPDAPETFRQIEETERQITAMIDTYHANAFYNRIFSRVITFRIQSDNKQALEAISDEIKTGLENLKIAVKQADIKEIRANLKALKGFDKLLPDAAGAELQKLVNDMRARARNLNKLINKQGKTLDDSEVSKLLDAANVDAAELAIFEIDDTDTCDLLPAMDLDDFQPAEIPTAEPETAAAQETEQTDAADFQPVEIAEPAAETAAAPQETEPAPAPELQTDATPEHDAGDDWTDGDAARDAEKDEARAELLDKYEAAEGDDAKRAAIRAALTALDTATVPATA